MADKPGEKVQLKDVARAAGVSPATASMVFNGTGRISLATKERVLAAAENAGYRHPTRSRRKGRRRTPIAGILVSTDQ